MALQSIKITLSIDDIFKDKLPELFQVFVPLKQSKNYHVISKWICGC